MACQKIGAIWSVVHLFRPSERVLISSLPHRQPGHIACSGKPYSYIGSFQLLFRPRTIYRRFQLKTGGLQRLVLPRRTTAEFLRLWPTRFHHAKPHTLSLAPRQDPRLAVQEGTCKKMRVRCEKKCRRLRGMGARIEAFAPRWASAL